MGNVFARGGRDVQVKGARARQRAGAQRALAQHNADKQVRDVFAETGGMSPTQLDALADSMATEAATATGTKKSELLSNVAFARNSAAAIRRAHGDEPPTLHVKEPATYGLAHPNRSWVMDAAVTQLSQRGIPNLLGGPGMRNAEEENPLENIRRHEVDLREEFNHGSEERKAQILEILRNRHRTDTRGRAQDVEYAKRAFRDDLRELWGGSSEYRADTTSTGSLGTFLTPQHMTEEWGNYLEAAGSVWAAGTPLPLAEHGIEQYLPRLTGPINVTTQPQADENDSISQTDPSATYSSSAIVPIVAVSTVSYQAYQRSGGDAGAGFALDKMYARQFAIGTGVQRDNLVIPVLISAAYNTISDSASAGYAPFMQDVARAQALIATQPGVFLPSDRVFLSSPFLRYLEQTTDDEGRPIFPPASYGGKFAQDGSGDTGDQVGGAVICTDDNSLLAFLTAGTASAGFSASSGYGLVGQFEQGLLTFASSAPIFDVWPEGLAQTLTMVLTFRTYASFQTPLGGGPFAVLTGSYYGLGA